MKIYISGKISGLPPEQTQRKFSDAADLLHNLDCEPVNPFQIGVSHSNASWKQHMIRDIELLMHCDGILLLDDWKESKGARIEKKIADEMGLIILHESSCRMIEQEQNILIRVKKAIKSVTGLDFETYISESRLRDYFYARMMF